MAFGLGGPKKDVMLAPLGFLLSAAGAERWSEFRFSAGLTMAKRGGNRRDRERIDIMQHGVRGLSMEKGEE